MMKRSWPEEKVPPAVVRPAAAGGPAAAQAPSRPSYGAPGPPPPRPRPAGTRGERRSCRAGWPLLYPTGFGPGAGPPEHQTI